MTAIHPKVTRDIVQMYNDVGVTHVPGAVDADWVTSMSALLDDIIARLRSSDLEYGEHPIARSAEFEDHDGYIRLINIYWREPEMRRLVEESDLAHIVADVIGADTMQPWVDGTFLKEGNAEETATPWHNDECLFPLKGHHSPSMWIALTDIDRSNAPLQTLAGSNQDPHRYVSSWALGGVEPPPNFHPWDELLERVSAPDADIRVWEAKAGDMLVIHPKTIHASLPRKAGTEGRRLGFSLRWLGSDIIYENNPTAKRSPFQDHPDIKEGHPIPEALYPVTWRRG